MDINKLKLPDDWAKDYESPVTLQIRKIAEQIEEQRENQITAVVSEQMAVNIDKDELKRALAYDRFAKWSISIGWLMKEGEEE